MIQSEMRQGMLVRVLSATGDNCEHAVGEVGVVLEESPVILGKWRVRLPVTHRPTSLPPNVWVFYPSQLDPAGGGSDIRLAPDLLPGEADHAAGGA